VQSTGEKRRLYIVSQETNLAMQGILGFFMNYTNIIPISRDHKYMSKYFEPMVSHVLQEGNVLLIYPEQEMWFHYRKPRPGKRGAYYYAALYGVPVVSCFVEMQELKSWDKKPFHKLQFILHVLPVIYPDPARTVQENSREMAVLDYQQRMLAYEQAYGKKLVYDFTPWDIAGWEQTETGIF
jgi:1-acyl-sn-glycerol-3-phosphate acyltransferase